MSDFWLQKMRTYFDRIDLDRDGSITRHDFEAMADRFQKKAKCGADALSKRITSVYDDYLGKECKGEPVKQEAFINIMRNQIGNADLEAKFRGPLPLLFKAVDTDEDGQISPDEYKAFFEIMGIDIKFSEETFKAIDENNDGQLSEEEFVNAGLDFFKNQQKSANSQFWGPLVE